MGNGGSATRFGLDDINDPEPNDASRGVEAFSDLDGMFISSKSLKGGPILLQFVLKSTKWRLQFVLKVQTVDCRGLVLSALCTWVRTYPPL